jgi:exosortase/archaeosortase family protein
VTAGALPGRPAGHRAGGHRAAGRRAGDRRGSSGPGSGGPGSGGHGRRGSRSPQAATGTGARAGQVLASVLCCALAATAVKENYLLRGFEAGLASHVIAFVTSRPSGSIPRTPTFWFTVGPHHEMGLQISAACTVVLMMTPFLIATAFLVWRRSHTVRPVVACLVAIAMLLVVNQLRILTIIMFVLHLGYAGGFYWGHTLVGSLITIVGGSATLVVYGLIAIRRGTSGRTRQSAR